MVSRYDSVSKYLLPIRSPRAKRRRNLVLIWTSLLVFTVDVSYLTQHHVLYANTPVAVSDPTATAAVMHVLQVVRGASHAEAVVRRGEWRLGLEASPDVRDVTVGLIGMGSIGRVSLNDICITTLDRSLLYFFGSS